MRCALVFVGALGLVVAPAAAASAHVQEIGTSPGTRVVARLPLAVSVTFDEPLRPRGVAMRVIGRDGLDYGDGAATVYRATTLRRDIRVGAPNGPYTVTWEAVAADGHRQTGSFGFIAAHSNATLAPTSAPSESARTASVTPSPLLPTSQSPLAPRTDPHSDSGLRGALGSEQNSGGDDESSRSLFTYLPLGLGAVLVVAAGLVSLVTRRRNAAAEAERDRSPLSR
jgi:methionine-rich copper-binding protein CopC